MCSFRSQSAQRFARSQLSHLLIKEIPVASNRYVTISQTAAEREKYLTSCCGEKMTGKAEYLDNQSNRHILVGNKLPETDTLSSFSGNKPPRIVFQSWVFF
jgi:hypothetical protein